MAAASRRTLLVTERTPWLCETSVSGDLRRVGRLIRAGTDQERGVLDSLDRLQREGHRAAVERERRKRSRAQRRRQHGLETGGPGADRDSEGQRRPVPREALE